MKLACEVDGGVFWSPQEPPHYKKLTRESQGKFAMIA
jgi:hypothetical protein